MTNFSVCNNIFINFNSHRLEGDIELFKDFVRGGQDEQ